MIVRNFRIVFLVLLSFLSVAINGVAQDVTEERHIKVAMRMVGHEILLSSGDSSSIVLPIKKEEDQYMIEFETEFAFNPEVLKAIVDSVFAEARIQSSYIVEVENSETKLIVYSYVVGNQLNPDMIPCQTRSQPKASYSILLTLLEDQQPQAQEDLGTADLDKEPHETNYFGIGLVCTGFLLFIGLFVYFWRKSRRPKTDPNTIALGGYQFDKRNLHLSYNDETTDLTSKEADLLALLHASANFTIKREEILKNVWGDEGDYVGRTLDVFISKLRKKLEADTSVKIVNIRGVGYKLVLNS